MLISKRLINKPQFMSGVAYDIMKLEIFCNEILPLEEEIVKAEIERTEYGSPIKTVAEIQKELQEVLDNDLVRMDAVITEFVEKCQTGYPGAITDLFFNLKQYIVMKDFSKHLYLIKGRSKVENTVPENVRKTKVKELDEAIAKAKEKRVKTRPLVKWDAEKKYVERWRMVVANYFNPVEAGGLWLSDENPMHKRLKVLYEALKLDEIPKNKMYKSLIIDGIEFPIHPGHHYLNGDQL